jgi:hypothetical protein
MYHIMDTLVKFREIIEKLERIKLSVVKQSGISYRSQDARMVALDALQISISAVGMWIRSFNSLANIFTKDGNFNETGFLNSIGSGVSVAQTEEIMLDHLRLGFMTLVHFKFDNLFHNILKNLNVLPPKRGFWNLTDGILSQCMFSERDTTKQTLTALANLRNSLHSNGIHRNDSLTIEIDGIAFAFIKGRRVECASWNHIIVLLNASVDILETILLSSRVANIRTEIEDVFASGK